MIVCYECREPLHFAEEWGWVHKSGLKVVPNPPGGHLMGAFHKARPVDGPTEEEAQRRFEQNDLCTS